MQTLVVSIIAKAFLWKVGIVGCTQMQPRIMYYKEFQKMIKCSKYNEHLVIELQHSGKNWGDGTVAPSPNICKEQ